MKPIDQMSLAEALAQMRNTVLLKSEMELCDRIHDLTRWIPVSERMPTEADADKDGCVLVSATERSNTHHVVEIWSYEYVSRNGLGGYKPTHWKRTTPPEGV
jgi:hypothetical protein